MARAQSDRRETLVWKIADLVRAYQREVDQLDDAACAYLGINRTDARCLDTIHQLGPLSPSALAREAGLPASSMTTVLDRLERRGFARRMRDKSDRRRVLVEMTAHGRKRTMKVYGPLATDTRRRFAPYDERQLEFLRDFFNAERDWVARWIARVREMDVPRKREQRKA